jgi:hypothetical protein
VRWDGLFADLEAQAGALDTGQRAAEIEERARTELGRIRLQDRLRPATGTAVRVRCRGALAVAGTVSRVGAEWLLLDEGGNREALVVTAMLISVSGLGRLSAAPDTEGVVESRLGLRHALRGIVRDRSAAAMHLVDGTTADGTIDRIGADFVEIAAHPTGEPRRRGEVRDVLVVPLGSVVAVRRQA